MSIMSKTSYFFERKEFQESSLKKPSFYIYKGYYSITRQEHPVTLHFDRDEIVISYKDFEGRTYKVFSLYVAEGELNMESIIKLDSLEEVKKKLS